MAGIGLQGLARAQAFFLSTLPFSRTKPTTTNMKGALFSSRLTSISTNPFFYTSIKQFPPLGFIISCLHSAPPATLHHQQQQVQNLSSTQLQADKVVLKDLVYSELEEWVLSMGHRKTQAMMLWRWLYGHDKWIQSVDQIVGINKDFRQLLQERGDFGALLLHDIYEAKDGTRKILSTVDGGSTIETVVIPCDGGRTTVCVSSQVGCAMNCQFCFTGRMGLKKNLTTAQIVEQLVGALRLFNRELGPITNVVFMGMGEPLHNFENVIRATKIMTDLHGLHLSPNKVTVSTSGLVPQLKRFCRETPCSLAVSLNATTDEVRNWIMPINRKYNLSMLLSTLKEEIPLKKDFKVLFEYVLLSGINDSMEDAMRLTKLVDGIPCKINLLTFNPHSGAPFIPSSKEKTLTFKNALMDAGLLVFTRESRGNDQMAACGQLGQSVLPEAPRLRVPSKFHSAVGL